LLNNDLCKFEIRKKPYMPYNLRIFVLDDDMSRILWFQENFKSVSFAFDPVKAWNILKNEEYNFDIIFLDHDLGGAFTRGSKGDGIDLARQMAKEGVYKNTRIIVHSRNPQGAQAIEEALKETHTNIELINYLNLREIVVNEKFTI